MTGDPVDSVLRTIARPCASVKRRPVRCIWVRCIWCDAPFCAFGSWQKRRVRACAEPVRAHTPAMGNVMKILRRLLGFVFLPVAAASSWSESYADQLRRQALARLPVDDPARPWLVREIDSAAQRRRG
jgi:hypothetical protein